MWVSQCPLATLVSYHIQIARNGFEWVRRALTRSGREFVLHGNEFLHFGDHDRVQALLNAQQDVRGEPWLAGFLPSVFSTRSEVVGAAGS